MSETSRISSRALYYRSAEEAERKRAEVEPLTREQRRELGRAKAKGLLTDQQKKLLNGKRWPPERGPYAAIVTADQGKTVSLKVLAPDFERRASSVVTLEEGAKLPKGECCVIVD